MTHFISAEGLAIVERKSLLYLALVWKILLDIDRDMKMESQDSYNSKARCTNVTMTDSFLAIPTTVRNCQFPFEEMNSCQIVHSFEQCYLS